MAEKLNLLTARDRFWHELPQLLTTNLGKWVVCTAIGVCHIGDDEKELYQWCRQQKLPEGTYVVAQVLPDDEVELVADEWVNF